MGKIEVGRTCCGLLNERVGLCIMFFEWMGEEL